MLFASHRSVLVWLLAILCLPVPLAAGEKHAVLIGVAKYNHAGMAELKYPEDDAKALGELLKEGGYEVDLLLGEQATGKAIRERFRRFPELGQADGVLIVGLFGHGVEAQALDAEGKPQLDGNNRPVTEGCFCPYDTAVIPQRDELGQVRVGKFNEPLTEPDRKSLISLAELLRELSTAKAGVRVVLADCCRTDPKGLRGRSFGASFETRHLPATTSVLFACSPGEQAFEHKQWGHGAFTKCLLEELPRMSGKGNVKTGTLVDRLKETVPALVASVAPRDRQEPKLFATDSVDLRLKFKIIKSTSKNNVSSTKKNSSIANNDSTSTPNDNATITKDADFDRGWALWFGLGEKIDQPKAVELLRQSADRDNPLAMAMMARFHQLGDQVSADPVEAERWANLAYPKLEPLANRGDLIPLYLVGLRYDLGLGCPVDGTRAVRSYEAAANKGYAPAQNNLGSMYLRGESVFRDPDEAVKWIRKAADQNLAIAQLNLGSLYYEGRGVTKDHTQALKWTRKAADQNHPTAQADLGYMYYNGVDGAKNTIEAAKWLRKAAKQNSMEAYRRLGWLHITGEGVEKDLAQAVRMIRMAADQNNPQAQNDMGTLYANGTGVGKDQEEAIKWFRMGAEHNNADAQNNLGIMYQLSDRFGFATDPQEAVKWFRKAAEQNHADGQRNLGHMYNGGNGVDEDPVEAAAWFLKAAEQNHAQAQTDLGALYYAGRGVSQSYPEALKWFRKAAKLNSVNAQANLGVMYEQGEGVAKDVGEAVKWYRLALQNPSIAEEKKELLKEQIRSLGKTP